jgi:hypothetical protein
MSSDTDTTDNRDASLRDQLPRRHVLKLIGLVAATGRASAQSDGDVAIGGGGADHDFRHGAWSFAPPTLPPDEPESVWFPRDESTPETGDATLPLTFQANGAEWSFASDLATAESNTTTTPYIAIASDGWAIEDGGSSRPVTWTGGGVEHVVADTLSEAQTAHSGARPAVLFAASGVGSGGAGGVEVVA